MLLTLHRIGKMTNNLEDIPYHAVISAHGESYSQFRTSLSPQYGKAWLHITTALLLLTIPFLLSLILTQSWRWLLLPVFLVYFGYLLAFLHLFIHEAAHFNLYHDKKINDRLAIITLCPFFGINLKNYRKTHWTHHLHLATPDDVEISYFNPITLSFLARILTGVHVLSVIQTRKKMLASLKEDKPSTLNWKSLLVVHALFLVAAWYCGSYPLMISWILAVAMVFPFLATLRQILEHRSEYAGRDPAYYLQSRQRLSRIFGNNFFSKTFGAAGFNRHMIHHWDPQISYTRLDDVIRFLEQCPSTSSVIRQSRSSYSRVFLQLSRKL